MLRTAGSSQPAPDGSRFSAPMIAGLHDGLGERWFTTWAADGSPVEVLQLRGDISGSPEVERVLRERVSQLATFRHPAFPGIYDLYSENGSLTLVSSRVSGARLSELTARDIPKAGRPAFVVRVLQQALEALAALEAVAPGVTHGALTADRIFVTSSGVRISEYTFAPALQQLALWPEESFQLFGLIACLKDEQSSFDPRTTVMQLGLVALSVLLDRPMSEADVERRLPALIEEVEGYSSASLPRSSLPAVLRTWLEHALQVREPDYASSLEAQAGLNQLLAAAGAAAAGEIATAPFPAPPAPRVVAQVDTSDVVPSLATATAPPPQLVTPAVGGAAISVPRNDPAPPVGRADAARIALPRYVALAGAVLAIVAIVEAGVLAWLMQRRVPVPLDVAVTIESSQPGTTVAVDGRTAGAAPVKLQITPNTRAIRVVPSEPVAPPPVAATVPLPTQQEANQAAALAQAAARQRSGGVAFVAPIPLSVLEGDRVLGSTADGPIVATAGQHTLDLVNTALGYRVRQVVTIRAGAIARLPITPPMGRISINAQPWAQVLIDDTAVGETPLANVPATIGEHQVTFRHPQFGERRERVVVRADAPARVSTTFQR